MLNTRQFKKGDLIKHFKREQMTEFEKEQRPERFLYRFIGTCVHTESGEAMCVYESLEYPTDIYARPKEMFYSEVDHVKFPEIKQRYRLEKIDFEKI